MARKPRPAKIGDLLKETRRFKPRAEFARQANINKKSVYASARRNPEDFWASMASALVWKKKWRSVLKWNPPDAKWFVGGKLNVTESCLDRHILTSRKNKAALIW